MTVYLIHLHTPLGHSRHYLGITKNYRKRMKLHETGQGAKMLAVCLQRGITWEVARTWEVETFAQAREMEVKYKAWHNHAPLCPLCRQTRRHCVTRQTDCSVRTV